MVLGQEQSQISHVVGVPMSEKQGLNIQRIEPVPVKQRTDRRAAVYEEQFAGDGQGIGSRKASPGWYS
jgi:hypothetical protein